MVDVDRDSIGAYTRNVDNNWETKSLEHDREFRTLVDPVDVDETQHGSYDCKYHQCFQYLAENS